MWIGRTFHNHLALIHNLTVVNKNLLLFRNQEFICFTVHISNNQTLFTFGFFTEGYGSGYFCQYGSIFW